jgi:hypothetical protein
MLVAINKKTDRAFVCKQVDVSKLIGVSPVTVSRWKAKGLNKVVFNYWTIYFNYVFLKSKSGFAAAK